MSARAVNKGDRVAFIDEVGGGVVLDLLMPGRVRVRTDDGFELVKFIREVVPYDRNAAEQAYRITDHQAGMVAANDVMDEQRKKRIGMRLGKTPKRPEDGGVAEVDLHLHELVEDETRFSDGEKLRYQLAYFERSLEAAIRDGKRKLIVIHGIGEGVLREEVRKVLQYYENVRFHDANMARYGSGATEVEILRH
ncbi:MAG: Smr/MutS family protein [Flavobacteriales bacterium]|jgi:DNA-nicking Smr family endonuclease|nr:Smr/MutS family protein [Flavobacteriales bacterium]MBK6551005.1 Smr/MutS family protein [Flavobacteriales bacterium]MBK6882559.1 Smr/MutS family protein [Flavobacteriales bacterium]MBK7103598.1 Smr/MutS family protein [Flavobacteriales bacterium]MBK7111928.1 Smr/MutS family protein [Flavobacteriales bacterium]